MKKQPLPVVFLTIMLAPFAMGMSYSLLYSLGLIGSMSEGLTLMHWKALFFSSGAGSGILYTLYLVGVSLILVLSLALLVSWIMIRSSFSFKVSSFLFLPLTFAPVVAGFIWYYILSPSGILSRISYHTGVTNGISEFPGMVNDRFGIGILVVHVFLIFPLFAILFTQISKKENVPALHHLSGSLGGNSFQFFRRVYIPLMLRKSLSLIVLYGVFLLGTFEVPLILGVSSPRVITVFITEKLTRYNLQEIPVGYAMAVVYGLIVFLLVWVIIRNRNIRII